MNNSRISLKTGNLMGKEAWESRVSVHVVQEGVNRNVLADPYVKTEESKNYKSVNFYSTEDNFILLYLSKNKVDYLKKVCNFLNELRKLPSFLEPFSSLSSSNE